MKILPPCLLLVVGLAAGLTFSLRPRATPSATAAKHPSVPASATLSPKLAPGFTSASTDTILPAEADPLRLGDATTAAARDRTDLLQADLVARDPALDGQAVLAQEPGAERDESLRQFIRQWAATDLGGVLTWVTSLLDETDRRNAAQALTAQVAQDDPAGAIELGLLLRVGLEDGSLERRVQLWTEEKPGEAMGWVVQRPADSARDRLLARVAWTRAQREPAEAAGLVLDHMTPGDARDEALISVVRQWAVRDPAPASTWVASFPAGPLHNRALAELAVAARLR